jgi:hypothetical protein
MWMTTTVRFNDCRMEEGLALAVVYAAAELRTSGVAPTQNRMPTRVQGKTQPGGTSDLAGFFSAINLSPPVPDIRPPGWVPVDGHTWNNRPRI